jgi:hypothetical protein
VSLILIGISHKFIKHILKPNSVSTIIYVITYKVCLMINNSWCSWSTYSFLSSLSSSRISSIWSSHKVIKEFLLLSPGKHTYLCSFYICDSFVIHNQTHSYLISISYIIWSILISSNILSIINTKSTFLNYDTELGWIICILRCILLSYINTIYTGYI